MDSLRDDTTSVPPRRPSFIAVPSGSAEARRARSATSAPLVAGRRLRRDGPTDRLGVLSDAWLLCGFSVGRTRRVRLAPGRSGDSANKAERAKRRAEAEAVRREHKRECFGGGSGPPA
jgi:hypothetical protein